MSDIVNRGIVSGNGYTAITEDEIEKILEELGLDISGWRDRFTSSQIYKILKEAGVNITGLQLPDVILKNKLHLTSKDIQSILSQSGIDISNADFSKLNLGSIDLEQFGIEDISQLDANALSLLNIKGLNNMNLPGFNIPSGTGGIIQGGGIPSTGDIGGILGGSGILGSGGTASPNEFMSDIRSQDMGFLSSGAASGIVAKSDSLVGGSMFSARGSTKKWTITDEFGLVKLDSTDLPGIFSSMDISQEVEIEQKEVKGSSKRAKQLTGYSDATVTLNLVLHTDDNMTCYDRLRIIQAKFRSTDSAARPQIMSIFNVHTAARGIERVIFKSLSTSESENDTLGATLSFEEYFPVVPVETEQSADRPQRRTGSGGSSGDNVTPNAKGSPASVTPESIADSGKSEAQKQAERDMQRQADMKSAEAAGMSYTEWRKANDKDVQAGMADAAKKGGLISINGERQVVGTHGGKVVGVSEQTFIQGNRSEYKVGADGKPYAIDIVTGQKTPVTEAQALQGIQAQKMTTPNSGAAAIQDYNKPWRDRYDAQKSSQPVSQPVSPKVEKSPVKKPSSPSNPKNRFKK